MRSVKRVSASLRALGGLAAGLDDASIIPQFSRYSLTSVVALAADFAIYVALFAGSVKASIAGVAGYGMGMLVHYLLSSRFVFDTGRSQKSDGRRFVEFALSGLVGITLTGFVIAVATEGCGLGPIAAKIIAAAISFAAVFAIRRRFVFAEGNLEIGEEGLSVYSKSGSSQ
jgi:putative flippase GtrA